MGFGEGSIILDSPTGTYYSGQLVNGRAVFELTKVKNIRGIYLKAKGFCQVHWTTQHSRRENDRTVHYTKNHDAYEEYINLKTYLVGSNSADLHLNPGKYEYPFSFQLPPTCPSSYENSLAHVRYQVEIVADRPFRPDQEFGHALRVVAPLDLNTIDCKEPVEFEFDQTYCCWCMKSGSSETLVKLPVTGYCAGQIIPLEVSCKNTSSVEITHIRFTIKKNITFRAIDSPGEKSEKETLLEVRKGPVAGHTDRNWTVEMPVPDVDYCNLQHCSFIDITYTFKVSVEPDGCHSDSDDSCRLYLGTVPLRGVEDINPNPIPDQLPQTTLAYPPAYNSYPQPVIQQPSFNQNTPYPGVTSPLPANPSYPGASPFTPKPQPDNTSPYPGGNSPYPGGNPGYPAPSPYPAPNPPYPNTNSPFANPPYPTTPQTGSAPYPGASPYPASPGMVNATLVKSDNPGFGSQTIMPMPSLPPGAVPYPIAQQSPYAASAPGCDAEKPPPDAANSSPYNPDFLKN